MMQDYWIYDDYFIFKPEFNGSLYHYVDIISNYNKLIFSNYDDVEICVKTNNKYNRDYEKNYTYSKFNQPIEDGALDKLTSLQGLTFGHAFNQPVSGGALDKLTSLQGLTFGSQFNQPVSGGVFDKLTQLQQLTFGFCFNQAVSGGVFDKLTQLQQLTIGWSFSQPLNIPPNIKILKLDCNNIHITNNLSNGLEELVLLYNFNLELNDLPSSIKIILFDSYSFYYKELNNLPKSLEKLYLPEKYDREIKNINPNCQIIHHKSNKN
jgi:hypothetical protein